MLRIYAERRSLPSQQIIVCSTPGAGLSECKEDSGEEAEGAKVEATP